MIIKQQTTVVFDPVAEFDEINEFVENNPEYKLMGESTIAKVFAKTETWSLKCKANEVTYFEDTK